MEREVMGLRVGERAEREGEREGREGRRGGDG